VREQQDGRMSLVDALPATPQPGTPAPDFDLPDQYGERHRLSDLRGRSVVLVFYPWAFSSVCTGEMCAIRDRLPQLQNEAVQVLAVSCDARASLRAFSRAEGLDYPLLSDHWPHGEVSRRYGLFDERAGAALRGTFVIDPEGVVRWTVLNQIPDARDLDAWVQALDSLARPGA
jgi:peroxiredoxin